MQAHQPSLLEVRRRCDGRIRSLGSLGACVARVAVGSDGSRARRAYPSLKPRNRGSATDHVCVFLSFAELQLAKR